MDFINRHDAMTDLPATVLYTKLARYYPDSKFILTKRDPEKWVNSCETHFLQGDGRLLKETIAAMNRKNYLDTCVHLLRVFKRTSLEAPLHQRRLFLREKFYGGIDFSRERFAQAYHRHTENVQKFFRDKPERLLVVDICSGEGWEKICPFVEKPIPDVPFPKTNTAGKQGSFKPLARRLLGRATVEAS